MLTGSQVFHLKWDFLVISSRFYFLGIIFNFFSSIY